MIHFVQNNVSKDKKNILSLQMSLSKYYDKQYSNTNILNNIPYFKKNQKNTGDLNDLLRENKNDYEVEAKG